MTTTQNCLKHPDHMTQSGCTGIVSMTPGPGWHVEWDTADGTQCSQPLVGWGVQCNGEVVPLEADADGSVGAMPDTSRCVYVEPDIGPRELDVLDAIHMGVREVAQAVR